MRIAGMMCGTSYDAVDVAIADFEQDGPVLSCRPVGTLSRPVPDPVRDRIAAMLPPQPTTIGEVCRLDTELGQLFGAVAAAAIAEFGNVDLVVSHGQTVFHWVEDRAALGTLQLGAAAWIAEATGTAVLSDIRTRDISRGGQGAPLASTLDELVVLSDEVRRGALNLGGIANITVGDPDLIAYDIGPANALIDLAVSRCTGGAERMDTDGRRAARGTVDPALLERLLDEPYYALDPPKSTGKELFHAGYLASKITAGDHDHRAGDHGAGESSGAGHDHGGPDDHGTGGGHAGDLAALRLDDAALDDLVATLTELTARLIADACRRHRLEELVVAGGGVGNPTLMNRIASLSSPTTIRRFSDFGLPEQAKEAYLMALIGYLSWHGLPGTVASATGASSLLGSFTPGSTPLRLPNQPIEQPTRMIITT